MAHKSTNSADRGRGKQAEKTSISLNWKLSIEVNEIFGAPVDTDYIHVCLCVRACVEGSADLWH